MKNFSVRLRAFYDFNAWLLVLLGILLFSARVQFEPGGWINLPVAFTVFQTGGLMFSLFGLQLMASMAFWPSINLSELLENAKQGQMSSALVVAGLLVFNGLSIIGFSVWLTSALGAGVGAG